MLVNVVIKLKTPLLGDRMGNDGIRRFSREKHVRNDEFPLDTSLWAWALKQAAESVGGHIDADAFRIASSLRGPTLSIYNRRWTDKKGRKREDKFEAVRAGSVLSVPFMLFTEAPPGCRDMRLVTMAELGQVVGVVGRLVGVSPWGSKFGFGRFNVLAVEPA